MKEQPDNEKLGFQDLTQEIKAAPEVGRHRHLYERKICDRVGCPGPLERHVPVAPSVKTAQEVIDLDLAHETFHGTIKSNSGLADMGARVQSVTGSLREPKPVTDGRYDLIPAECVSWMLMHEKIPAGYYALSCALWDALELTGDAVYVQETVHALAYFAAGVAGHLGGTSPSLKRLAVHYARGAVKYADRNWQKGQQTSWVVSSLCRHFEKMIAGLTDEDHGAAVLWNTFTLMHHIPRIADGRLPAVLDDYGFVEKMR